MGTVVMTGPTTFTQQTSGHIMVEILHFTGQISAREIGDPRVAAEYLLRNTPRIIHFDWFLWAHYWAMRSTADGALDIHFPETFACGSRAFNCTQ